MCMYNVCWFTRCATVYEWRSDNNFVGSVLSFCLWVPGIVLRAPGLHSKCLYPVAPSMLLFYILYMRRYGVQCFSFCVLCIRFLATMS